MHNKIFECCTDAAGKTTLVVWSDFCAVAPSPAAKERLNAELAQLRSSGGPLAAHLAIAPDPQRLGLNDGVIIPPDQFPLGASRRSIASAALERAPLRGAVRLIVVLVDFSDKPMTQTAQHFNELFFSTGVLPNGSVKEYYREVTNGLVDLTGDVVGPFRLPQTLAWYANNNFGWKGPPADVHAPIMADDAAAAADPTVNFSLYDNDGDGYVDAFVVVHAGDEGADTLNPGDIWSHKLVLKDERVADGKKIYSYLTVAETCRIGVCAHELGHLLFGFPDLYDTDNSSEGVGNWCLMGSGSWNGPPGSPGEIPAHPSAWCKVQQGWVSVTNVTAALSFSPATGTISIPDVKTSRNVYRVWTLGAGGPEYFLLENRQRTGFDAQLPGDGLLIWHIDENQTDNTNENHYKVGLVQADGKWDLEFTAPGSIGQNRGDTGDPYPGSANNTAFTDASKPNSKSNIGQQTLVSVIVISASSPTMTARVSVGKLEKENKDSKDNRALKEEIKEIAELRKAVRDYRIVSQGYGVTSRTGLDPTLSALIDLEIAALETALGSGGAGARAEPFISADQRPDLAGGTYYNTQVSELTERMARGDRYAKIMFDTPPQR